MSKIINDWKLLLLLCLTLGLAPFFPEPHVWGKLKWIAGGAHGMEIMDWFDLIFHGFPFILMFRYLLLKFVLKKDK
tara:strand:+ start:11320 stop:11547 length:228 start_codon:yes stop_codon:yes gene_type:complete